MNQYIATFLYVTDETRTLDRIKIEAKDLMGAYEKWKAMRQPNEYLKSLILFDK